MADRYLLESGAPDGYLLEDGSGVLLLEGASFDPSTGFPYVAQDVAVQTRLRALSLRLDALSKPPSQFGTAVRFVGAVQNNGLVRTGAGLPADTNFSISCFFYVPATLGGDSSIWMLQNTTGGTPATYANLEVNATNQLICASFGAAVLGTVVPGFWYFATIAVGTGGNGNAYWGRVGAAALTSVSLAGNFFTGWTPASLTVGTDYFVEPFDGRVCSLIVQPGIVLSAAEALAQSKKLAPARTDGVSLWYRLEHATTKLVDSSGFGRDLTAIGAGTWRDEEGPFLLDDVFDPARDLSWAQQELEVPRRTRAPYVDALSFVPVIADAPVLTFWQPTFPDQLARIRRAAIASGDAVFALSKWGTDSLSWEPTFPDRVPGRAPLRTPSGPAYTPAVSQWGTDALAWLASFPDRVPGPRRALQAAEFRPVDFGAAPVVPPLSWAADFPDMLARARRRPELALAYTPAINRWGTDGLAWLPSFPERVPARRRPIAEGLIAYVPAVSRWGLDAPAFLEQAVDVVRPRRAVNVGGVAWVPLVAAPISLSWFEQAVDPVRRPRPLIVGGGSLVQLVAPVVVPPFSGVQLVETFRPRVWVARLVDGLVEPPLHPTLPVLPFTFGGAAYVASPSGPVSTSVIGSGGSVTTDNGGGESSSVSGGDSSEVENA